MRFLCVLMVAGIFLLVETTRASFVDDFNRADNAVVGNGWTELGSTASIDPQVVGNQASWINLASSDSTKSSWIQQTFEAADDVSVDLKWSTSGAANLTNTYMGFYIESPNTQDGLLVTLIGKDPNANYLNVKISYYKSGTQTDSWTGVSGNADYHNYRITVNDSGKTRVYIDGEQKWVSTDSGLDASVRSYVLASRYWRWHQFYADNFAAVPEPVSLLTLGLGMMGALLRRRY